MANVEKYLRPEVIRTVGRQVLASGKTLFVADAGGVRRPRRCFVTPIGSGESITGALAVEPGRAFGRVGDLQRSNKEVALTHGRLSEWRLRPYQQCEKEADFAQRRASVHPRVRRRASARCRSG